MYADNCNLYLITVKNASNSAIDLTAEDDAVDEVVEQDLIVEQPLLVSVLTMLISVELQ